MRIYEVSGIDFDTTWGNVVTAVNGAFQDGSVKDRIDFAGDANGTYLGRESRPYSCFYTEGSQFLKLVIND